MEYSNISYTVELLKLQNMVFFEQSYKIVVEVCKKPYRYWGLTDTYTVSREKIEEYDSTVSNIASLMESVHSVLCSTLQPGTKCCIFFTNKNDSWFLILMRWLLIQRDSQCKIYLLKNRHIIMGSHISCATKTMEPSISRATNHEIKHFLRRKQNALWDLLSKVGLRKWFCQLSHCLLDV